MNITISEIARLATPTAFSLFTHWRQSNESVSRALRALHIESCHNIGILEAINIKSTKTNDPSYLKASRALKRDEHQAIAILLDSHTESDVLAGESRETIKQTKSRLEGLLSQSVVYERDVDPLPIEIDDSLIRTELESLKNKRSVGLIPAASFIAIQIGILHSLADTYPETKSIRKNLRGGLRLRTVLSYERSIVRFLSTVNTGIRKP